jgi:predicted Rossmann-fold nucleotide-binding protein
MNARRPAIAVIGAGQASPALSEQAEEVGHEIAASGAILVCGGRGG